MFEHCGWHGSIADFLQTPDSALLTHLKTYTIEHLRLPVNWPQITAWKESYRILQQQCQLFDHTIDRHRWSIIFEYELPRERGRRPDVILLNGETIYVLEFKGESKAQQAHIDQVSAYARDLKNYHEESHSHAIVPILVLTKASNLCVNTDTLTICSPDRISESILSIHSHDQRCCINAERWLQSEYAPLPSLVSAARWIFEHESLPHIKRAESAGIPQTIDHLIAIANEAMMKNEFHCAFVTGVPGSGKTLVGLQFVYTKIFNSSDSERDAVFLSGNGPLVNVLQDALDNTVFVQGIHGFLKQYGGDAKVPPREHIWVFDEAQRAWDAERVQEKRGHPNSEPMDFLKIGDRMGSWAMVIGLIGEGQEIYKGEEAGIAQWNDAIAGSTRSWHVHCPEKIADVFSAAETITTSESLDLTVTLRSHLAEHLHEWVAALLTGEIDDAARLGKEIVDQGFDLYVTQDIAVAEQYARERYQGELDKRYGLVASSKASNLPEYGIYNNYQCTTKRVLVGAWYNAPPTSRRSCCQLHDVVTEFSCQGLELDMPIVCWGDDLIWSDGEWRSKPTRRSKSTRRSKPKDPHQLRINSYRVLLTRGRDGMIIFVPDEPNLEGTFQLLKQSNCSVLQ